MSSPQLSFPQRKLVHICFNMNFPPNKIYEFNIGNAGKTEIIFNACHTAIDIKLKTEAMIMLINSSLFTGSDTVIFDDYEELSQFVIVIRELILRFAFTVYAKKFNDNDLSDNEHFDNLSDSNTAYLKDDVKTNYETLLEIIKMKKLAMPNFNKTDHYAIKRQINWIRSILGRNVKNLPESIALQIIELLKSVDLAALQKK